VEDHMVKPGFNMKEDALLFAKEAVTRHPEMERVSLEIKRRIEEKYGPTWQCCVGTNFRSFVSHESRHFIYVPAGVVGKPAILLYKSS
jgi:dynein light chain LC8-type